MVLDKLPPHDIAAEEAVVAACLVDSEAVFKVADKVRPDDFFREKNAWVFQAILALWDRNEAINVITVASELAGRDRLEPIGGPAYLAQLVADLPTVVGVEYYAGIVARDAIYRRLISAAGTIAQMAYEGGADLESVLGRAETLLLALRSGEALRDFVHIRTLLEKYLEDSGLEGQEAAGPQVVRTGFIDLDTLLGGLKRGDLVVLAARPSMGKSALAMAFARNAAVGQQAKVAVFSLEMAGDQLAQRLLSSEAGVDSTRLRLGEHTEAEERRIMHAMGTLASADIWIDESSVLSVGEMRGKAMRLQREHGLDLIVIDYLQLMQGSSGGRNDNRVQEISYISRTLKTVARELNVPVVALSQLSRAVESRTPHIPMLSDLRESGCLTGDALVALADGRTVPIASLVGAQPDVVTLDGWKMSTGRACRVWRTGYRPVLRMATRTGRSIRATGNHRFRVLNGWKALDDLRPGDRIALPRTYPEPVPIHEWDAARVVLLGHLIGDGCYAPRQPLHYTSASVANLAAVADAARAAFGVEGRFVAQERKAATILSTVHANTNVDTIPIEVWPCVKQRMQELDITQRAMAALRGTTYGGTSHFRFAPSRAVLSDYASLLHAPDLLEIAESDLYWDTVDNIEPDGEEDVYDMSVPSTHNFVANGIVVHNSIEQDADVVMFIYREDYYTKKEDFENAYPERPSKSFPAGIAQVIVAKHRNGPVGNVDLRFVHKTAKFEDLMGRDDEPF